MIKSIPQKLIAEVLTGVQSASSSRELERVSENIEAAGRQYGP